MTDVTERFATEAPSGHPNRPPRDAATLILLDRSSPVPKVLMGSGLPKEPGPQTLTLPRQGGDG